MSVLVSKRLADGRPRGDPCPTMLLFSLVGCFYLPVTAKFRVLSLFAWMAWFAAEMNLQHFSLRFGRSLSSYGMLRKYHNHDECVSGNPNPFVFVTITSLLWPMLTKAPSRRVLAELSFMTISTIFQEIQKVYTVYEVFTFP